MTAFAERGISIPVILALAYIVQAQAAVWHMRFTDRIFGAPEAAPISGGRTA